MKQPNNWFCRILVDGWLEVVFPDSDFGQKILSAVQQLRLTWYRLLELRLKRGLGT